MATSLFAGGGMPPHGGKIIRSCHSDATAFSALRAMNSCSLRLAKTGKDEEPIDRGNRRHTADLAQANSARRKTERDAVHKPVSSRWHKSTPRPRSVGMKQARAPLGAHGVRDAGN